MENEVVEILDEEEVSYSNDDLFNISSWGADPSIRELIQSYDEDDMLKPELQRMYVWEKKEASRFIESILLGLPVPSIFLANKPNNVKLIVDGYQRIMTVYYFFKNKWAGGDEEFRLLNSDVINERWKNKTYAELDEDDQRRFRTYTIHAIIFEQKQPKDDSALFQIFERINTSGKALNGQEIRNCVYQGEMNRLLFELNKNLDWRYYYGEQVDKRMVDMELILRFFAIGGSDWNQMNEGQIVLKKLLSDYMKDRVKMSQDEYQRSLSVFTQTINFIKTYIGRDAFFNYQADLVVIRKKLYPTIFDSIMVATAIALARGYDSKDNLEEKRLKLLKDTDYRDSITQGTMRRAAIRRRVELALSYLYNMNL